MPDDTVLTIKETAALLKMTERTVYAMAKEGRLPGAAKIGGSWRVLRVKLTGWLEAGGDSPHVTAAVRPVVSNLSWRAAHARALGFGR